MNFIVCFNHVFTKKIKLLINIVYENCTKTDHRFYPLKKINLTIAFKKGNSCHITLTINVKHLLSSGTLDNT